MPPALCPFKYNGILFGHEKKKGNPAIWDNTDEHEGCYTIWNKTEKDKSYMSIIYMQTLKKGWTRYMWQLEMP